LDGKGFSKYTKKLNKPFDDGFSEDMDATAAFLCENIQGVKFAYTQSDEISLILTDFDTNETDAWFDNNIQKMVSISASMATAKFNQLRMIRQFAEQTKWAAEARAELAKDWLRDGHVYTGKPEDMVSNFNPAMFDARVFQVPTVDEMINAMIFRQQDATRNSVSMAAYHLLGDNATKNKSGAEKQEMIFQLKGVNWNDYKTKFKRGSVIRKVQVEKTGPNGEKVIRNKWLADPEIPIFTQDKDYLRKLIPTT
jgi:tRNA(His) 5'-end guanylyltransferase